MLPYSLFYILFYECEANSVCEAIETLTAHGESVEPPVRCRGEYKSIICSAKWRVHQEFAKIGKTQGHRGDLTFDAGQGIVYGFSFTVEFTSDLAIRLAYLVSGEHIPFEIGKHLLEHFM